MNEVLYVSLVVTCLTYSIRGCIRKHRRGLELDVLEAQRPEREQIREGAAAGNTGGGPNRKYRRGLHQEIQEGAASGNTGGGCIRKYRRGLHQEIQEGALSENTGGGWSWPSLRPNALMEKDTGGGSASGDSGGGSASGDTGGGLSWTSLRPDALVEKDTGGGRISKYRRELHQKTQEGARAGRP